jgi:hypothetical protein
MALSFFGKVTGGIQDEQDMQDTYNIVARSPNDCYSENARVRFLGRLLLIYMSL